MKVRQTTLANGLRIVTADMPGAFSATAVITVGVGSRFESNRDTGVSHFLEHLLFRGSKNFPTARHINGGVDAVGGNNNAGTSLEYTAYEIQVPAKHLPFALAVLCDMVADPLFEAVPLDIERGAVLEEMLIHQEDPESLCVQSMMKLLFPGHAIARPILGSAKLIQTVSSDAIRTFHKRHYGAPNMVVSVAGKVGDHRSVVKQVAARLSGLPNWKPTKSPPLTAQPSKHLVASWVGDTEQAQMLVGARADLNERDRTALELISIVLSSGMSSRLFTTIREERGLAYTTNASVDDFTDGGTFTAKVSSIADRADQALELLVHELTLPQPVTSKELVVAKEQLVAAFGFRSEDSNAVALAHGSDLVTMGKLETPRQRSARIRSITLEDVARVADIVLRPENFRLAVLGSPSVVTKLSRLFRTLVRA